MTLVFFAGMFVGSSLTYAWLRWQCERAFERFADAVRDEIDP